MASPSLGRLPIELILQMLPYLDDDDIVAVQSTCRRLRTVCRDGGFWRACCFSESRLASTLRRKKWRHPAHQQQQPQSSRARRIEIRAAWNDVFDNGEPISWYDEHVQRNTRIATNWFELPRRHDGHRLLDNADVLEVCGVALYRPQGVGGRSAETSEDEKEYDDVDKSNRLDGISSLLAVAPLEDGSVCIWDINGTVTRSGAIVQQSAPGLLFAGIQDSENEKPVFNVTECVAVDRQRSLAYFAVQNRLVEVDLQTLSVVATRAFPQNITALSSAHPSVPLSVGTRAGIHLHDSRAGTEEAASTQGFRSADEIIDDLSTAPFPQPGPLSILHVQEYGSEDAISNDIFAAGRISSILHYDRRKLSVVKNAIHSGASLCGLASIPYPFPAIEDYSSLKKKDKGQALEFGRTVVACGEYKSKGSLELYPVDESHADKHMVNRQTSSSAKIFSVASHGTRLAVSDGAGFIRWFERDGFTEVRRYALGSDDYDEDGGRDPGDNDEAEGPPTEATRMAPRHSHHNSTESGDIARKLLPIHQGSGSSSKRDTSYRNNGLLFWTGDKLGLISFTRDKGTRSADFVKDTTKTEAERATEEEGKAYRTKMRQLFKSARYFGEDSDSDD